MTATRPTQLSAPDDAVLLRVIPDEARLDPACLRRGSLDAVCARCTHLLPNPARHADRRNAAPATSSNGTRPATPARPISTISRTLNHTLPVCTLGGTATAQPPRRQPQSRLMSSRITTTNVQSNSSKPLTVNDARWQPGGGAGATTVWSSRRVKSARWPSASRPRTDAHAAETEYGDGTRTTMSRSATRVFGASPTITGPSHAGPHTSSEASTADVPLLTTGVGSGWSADCSASVPHPASETSKVSTRAAPFITTSTFAVRSKFRKGRCFLRREMINLTPVCEATPSRIPQPAGTPSSPGTTTG
jgi:hypothetical protein